MSEQARTAIIDTLHERHHIRSAHRCSCGWEGDSATAHIIDTLGLRLAECRFCGAEPDGEVCCPDGEIHHHLWELNLDGNGS